MTREARMKREYPYDVWREREKQGVDVQDLYERMMLASVHRCAGAATAIWQDLEYVIRGTTPTLDRQWAEEWQPRLAHIRREIKELQESLLGGSARPKERTP